MSLVFSGQDLQASYFMGIVFLSMDLFVLPQP